MIKRLFGVEIEWSGRKYHEITGKVLYLFGKQAIGNWQIVTDDSCGPLSRGGKELVSPPMSGKRGLSEINHILDIMAEFDIANAPLLNASCGLHVHVDARDFTVKMIKRVFRIMYQAEPVVYGMQPKSRIRSKYCTPMKVSMDTLASCRTMDDIRAWWERKPNCGIRRRGLNLSSIWKHGTIEFRYHKGTLDRNELISWVLFCLKVMDKAYRSDIPSVKPAVQINHQSLSGCYGLLPNLLEKILKLVGFDQNEGAEFEMAVNLFRDKLEYCKEQRYNRGIAQVVRASAL